jgi:hypothetical protein
MRKKRREEGVFHEVSTPRRSGTAERSDQDRRWREALREAKQSVYEIFEDRGPGVAVPPAGMARRDDRGRR